MKNEYKLMIVSVLLLVFTLIITFVNHYKTKSLHENFVESTIKETIKKVKFDIDKADNTINLIIKYKKDYFRSIHNDAIKMLKNNPKLTIKELRDILNKKLKHMGIKTHLYLIDKNYIVYDTTNKKDKNLDMKLFQGAKDNLDLAFNNPSDIVVATPTIDILTKKYTTYSYGMLDKKTNNLLEIGFFDGELSILKEEMYKYHIKNSLVENIEIYADYKNYIINLTKNTTELNITKEEFIKKLTSQLNSEQNKMLIEIVKSGKQSSKVIKENGKTYKIVYTPIKDIKLSHNSYKNYIIKLKIDITEFEENIQLIELIFMASIILFFIFFALFLFYLSRSVISPMHNKILEQYDELRKQHNFTNTLIQNAPTSIYYQDKNAEFTACNSVFEQLVGLDKKYIIGKTILDILPKDDAINFTTNDSNLFHQNSKIEVYESKVLNFRTHEIKDVIFYKSAIINNFGEVEGIIGVILDVTDQKLKDKQLEELNRGLEKKVQEQIEKIQTINENFESVFNTSRDGMMVLDKDYNYIVANNSFHRILSVNKNIFQNKNCKDFAIKTKNHALQSVINLFEERNYVSREEIKFKDGNRNIKHVLITIEYMKNLENILMVITDITSDKIKDEEEKQKEKKMIEQSKLAQMGEMISMIAHQWRQPLTSISSTLISIENKLMLKKFEILKDERAKEFELFLLNKMSDISNLTIHLSDTIDDFRNFYRKDVSLEHSTSQKIIEDTLRIIGHSIESDGITINIDSNDTVNLKCYKNQLMQVFLNILKNCQDNFNERKTPNKTIWINSHFIDGKHIIILRDNGGGINEDILSKIFEPYFSTKLKKNGTGLGLYMSKMIVEQTHNGSLEVANTSDGVEFVITLNKEI